MRVPLTKEDLIAFEGMVQQMWEKGKIRCPLHLSGGNEDQLIEIFQEVKDGDYVFTTHRNHYHALLSGVTRSEILLDVLKESSSPSRGRAGSMCINSPSHRFYSSAIVGGNCAIACGVAWAIKEYEKSHYFCDEDQARKMAHVWCFVGDGAVDNGHFWEAIQYAEGQDLPITYVIEDNNRSTCTPIKDRIGHTPSGLRTTVHGHPKVKWYPYTPRFPHVGSGKYVAF